MITHLGGRQSAATNAKVHWLHIDRSRGSIAAFFDISLPEKEAMSVNVMTHCPSLLHLFIHPFRHKLDSSHPKVFTHGSMWICLFFPRVCHLVSCFHISLHGRSVCQKVLGGGVITMATVRVPALGIFIPLAGRVLNPPPHTHTNTHISSHSLQPIATQDHGLSIQRPGDQFINYILFPAASLPQYHLHYTAIRFLITKYNLHMAAVMAATGGVLCRLPDKPTVQFVK